jgi:rhombotail lipoprotein
MKFPRLLLPAATGLALALSGCVSLWNTHRHQANSVVQFLYPGRNEPFIQPSIPTLRLPLRVGVAFVPPGDYQNNGYSPGDTFSEAEKSALLRRVAASFKALPFVQSIEVLPTTYLRPGGGFENLDQLRALMGVDVVALVAYDQAQITSDTAWSLSYWTIVGAYIVPAQKNDTHTLMEAVVYDIPSRSLLFRAPGVSAIQGRHSTLIRTPDELRADSARGFTEAAQDLTVNLQRELDAFKVRAREEPQSVHIEHKPGYSGGGGAIDGWFVGLLALLFAVRPWLRRPSPRSLVSHAPQS